MISLSIFPRADGMIAPGDGERIVEITTPVKIGCLAGGMQSGKPSVSIFIESPDGKLLFVQTSLALLLSAADAFKAVHGDPRT